MLHDQDLVSVQEVRSKVDQAFTAWQTYRNFTQEQIDAVVEAVAAKGRAHARRLAEMAVEETGMGNVADKYTKNMLTADLLPRTIRGVRTIGVLREIPELRVTEVGAGVGVVAAICPTTNPTSTVFFKTIISLKSGNAVVLSPHPRAKNCTCAAAALMAEAVAEAGAPAGIVQCLGSSTLEGTQALMKHPKVGVILATGGAGMVRAAYSSGKPAFGVGPGNVPILLDSSADITEAVGRIVDGKSFDFGTVCSSEQTVVAERQLRDQILSQFKAQKAYLLTDDQRKAVERTLFSGGTTVRADCVGKSPQRIAQMAGFSVADDVRILLAEIAGVGKEHPLSAEKLSPVLAILFTDGFDACMDACESILRFGGLGHTSVIHAKDEAKVRRFGLRMPSFRVLVNTASPAGSVGITTGLQPSMTLGCGAMAGNSTSDNVGPLHLINTKRIAWAIRSAEEALPLTPEPAAAPAGIDKAQLVAAVERYLAQKGVMVGGAASSAPAPAVRDTIAGVVDRFLAVKKPPEAAPPGPSCGCGVKTAEPQPEAARPEARKAEIPAPAVEIVDFVCEADVRAAINQKRKIFIGPKTIVTPSALELSGRDEILVRAER
ncbi:MAG: aldehyde dehydrogenase family protein [Acidobacteria bacterium]|nr:aldehyde dehydrogenase family protein [Acidobacteriota bacterium]